jgi:hypothetical protein
MIGKRIRDAIGCDFQDIRLVWMLFLSDVFDPERRSDSRCEALTLMRQATFEVQRHLKVDACVAGAVVESMTCGVGYQADAGIELTL